MKKYFLLAFALFATSLCPAQEKKESGPTADKPIPEAKTFKSNQSVTIGGRTYNLNTEVGMLVRDRELARQVTAAIERDIHPSNSWRTTGFYNPDGEVGRGKRIKVWFNKLLPIEPIL